MIEFDPGATYAEGYDAGLADGIAKAVQTTTNVANTTGHGCFSFVCGNCGIPIYRFEIESGYLAGRKIINNDEFRPAFCPVCGRKIVDAE